MIFILGVKFVQAKNERGDHECLNIQDNSRRRALAYITGLKANVLRQLLINLP